MTEVIEKGLDWFAGAARQIILFAEGRCGMNRKYVSRVVLAGVGLVLLWSVPGPSLAQASAQAPGPLPQATAPKAPTPRPVSKKSAGPLDDFAGLTYTEEQKGKISEIHGDTKSRMDKVSRDESLTVDQKQAMLLGYQRMEASQIFRLLTPEQQREVQQHAMARRRAMRQQQQRSGSQPAPVMAPQSPHPPAQTPRN